MSEKKRSNISLPLIITFTDEGVSFFRNHNKKLIKKRLSNNTLAYGMSLEEFSAPSIQNMIIANYVSRIELSRTAFTAKRSEIMDISKLIFYGILYRRFSKIITKRFMESSFVSSWNRSNPTNILDENSILSNIFIGKIPSLNNEMIDQIKYKIIISSLSSIPGLEDLTGEEITKTKQTGKKFLDSLNSLIWYILSVSQGNQDYNQLHKDIVNTLRKYLEKSKIAEYLSLMIMEFAINAEISQLKKLSKRLYKDKIDFGRIIHNTTIRNELIRFLESRNEFLTLSWKIRGTANSIGTDNKLQIMIYNKDNEYKKLKQKITDQKNVDINKTSLIDFYQEKSEDEFNSDLGMHYLSYMQEACKEQQIFFDSHMDQITDTDLNIITLSLLFQ
ncbi:MAG: hypothetical protein KAQ93_03330 [Spirochaetales bacterium]|nr:hypothetical protein [Spirochaetales bacterium]